MKRMATAVIILGVMIVAGVAESQYGPSAAPDGALIRLQGTNQVYVIQGGRKCYVPDFDTFQSRGYQWQNVVEVDRQTLDRIATGVPIPSVRQKYQYAPPGQSPDAQTGGMPARGPVTAPSMPGAMPDPGAAAGSFPGGIGATRPTFGKAPSGVPMPNPAATPPPLPGAGPSGASPVWPPSTPNAIP